MRAGGAKRDSAVQADVIHAQAAHVCGQSVPSPTWSTCAAYGSFLKTITKSGQDSVNFDNQQRPPYVSLRNKIVSGALTSRTFFTVWSFFLPL
jgi:hypothetical protein